MNYLCTISKSNLNQTFRFWNVKISFEHTCLKVHIFWEGHKILPVRSKVKILQNYVAFSEYMNFKEWSVILHCKLSLVIIKQWQNKKGRMGCTKNDSFFLSCQPNPTNFGASQTNIRSYLFCQGFIDSKNQCSGQHLNFELVFCLVFL